MGTAFPHLLKTFTGGESFPWRLVIIATSTISVLGGALIYFLVPPGPYRKPGPPKRSLAFIRVFKNNRFRAAAFGYFGHMWELYTFWAFVPVFLASYNLLNLDTNFNIPLLSFIIIGGGSLACVAGGYISQRYGKKNRCYCPPAFGMLLHSFTNYFLPGI